MPNFEQSDSIIMGVEWVVARDPRQGEQVGHTDVWAMPTRPFANRQERIVQLVLYYRFNDEMVMMLAVIEQILG